MPSYKNKLENLKQEFATKAGEAQNKPFDAVVVLCAEEVEVEGENKARIDAALEIIKSATKSIPLIFLGTVKHINGLQDYLRKNKFDISVIYPTKRLYESSWTQVKGLAQYLKEKPFLNLLIVTHAYHIPRIQRYCFKYFVNINYNFLPVGDIGKQSKQVESEINKIIKYAENGDLSLNIDNDIKKAEK